MPRDHNQGRSGPESFRQRFQPLVESSRNRGYTQRTDEILRVANVDQPDRGPLAGDEFDGQERRPDLRAQSLGPAPLPDEFHHCLEVFAGRGLPRKQRRQGAGGSRRCSASLRSVILIRLRRQLRWWVLKVIRGNAFQPHGQAAASWRSGASPRSSAGFRSATPDGCNGKKPPALRRAGSD